jgi:hypothetical protein
MLSRVRRFLMVLVGGRRKPRVDPLGAQTIQRLDATERRLAPIERQAALRGQARRASTRLGQR